MQFKCQSLLQHLADGWDFTGMLKNHFISPVPAQMRKRCVQYRAFQPIRDVPHLAKLAAH